MTTFSQDFAAAGRPVWALIKGVQYATEGLTARTTLVVYNTNSSLSSSIAQYYMGVRAIPPVNICGIDVPTSAYALSREDYNSDVVDVIQTHIATNSRSIRCIVLMPDIPMGLASGMSSPQDYVSMESALSAYGATTKLTNPYMSVNWTPYTSREQARCGGMWLVSRVDGPGSGDAERETVIKAMLDSAISGEALRNAQTPMPGRFYFDYDQTKWNTEYGPYFYYQPLAARGLAQTNGKEQ